MRYFAVSPQLFENVYIDIYTITQQLLNKINYFSFSFIGVRPIVFNTASNRCALLIIKCEMVRQHSLSPK